MFKRLTWLGVGVVAGLGTSKWLERKARQQLARYLPAGQLRAGAQMADRARERATDRIVDLRMAVDGGRDAMAAKETELRRQLGLAEPELDRPERLAHGPDKDGRRSDQQRRGRQFDR
jgi:hypothetical protein